MTRAHAARMLLAHGPLTFRDFATITGWPVAACRSVLSYLVDTTGQAMRAHRLYILTHGNMPDLQGMEPEGERRHGPVSAGPLQPTAALELLPAAAPLQKLQASRAESSARQEGLGG